MSKDIDYPLFIRGIIHGNPTATELYERGANLDEISEAVEEALKADFGDPGTMPLKAFFIRAA